MHVIQFEEATFGDVYMISLHISSERQHP